MALTQVVSTDLIEVVGDYALLQVRETLRVMDGEKEIAQSFNRYVVAPGDDVSDKPQRVQDMAALLHTPDVEQQYRDSLPQSPEEVQAA